MKAASESDPLESLKLAIQDITEQTINWRSLFGGVLGSLQESFSSTFQAMLSDAGNWSDALSSILDDLKRSFFKMIADIASQNIMKGLFGLFNGGGTGTPALALPGMGGESGGSGGGASGEGNSLASLIPGGFGAFTKIPGITGSSEDKGFFSSGIGAAIPGLATAAGMGILGSSFGETQGGGILGGALAGGGAGMGLGAALGGIGGPIGLVAGGILGGVGGFFESKDQEEEKEKAKEQQEAAQAAQAEALKKQQEAAKEIIINYFKTSGSGGLASTQLADEAGSVLGGGVSLDEIEQYNHPGASGLQEMQGILQGMQAISVGGIMVNVGQVSSSYDVQQLGQELGTSFVSTVTAAGGAP